MFVENMNKVLTECPEDWVRCVKNHPDLTVEITTEIAKRQRSVAETPHYENVPFSSVQQTFNEKFQKTPKKQIKFAHIKCSLSINLTKL